MMLHGVLLSLLFWWPCPFRFVLVYFAVLDTSSLFFLLCCFGFGFFSSKDESQGFVLHVLSPEAFCRAGTFSLLLHSR